MPITALSLYRDMLNFFRNHLSQVLLIVLLTTALAVVLGHMFTPSDEALQTLQKTLQSKNDDLAIFKTLYNMPLDQQNRILHFMFTKAVISLVTYTFLIAGILTLLKSVNQGENPSALQAINASFRYFPRLLLLIMITRLLIEVGSLFFILPGLILFIAFILSPIVCIQEQCSATVAMRVSAGLAFKRLSYILPILISWGICQLLMMLSINTLSQLPTTVFLFILYGVGNLVSALLLIYLFRLYLLIIQEQA